MSRFHATLTPKSTSLATSTNTIIRYESLGALAPALASIHASEALSLALAGVFRQANQNSARGCTLHTALPAT